MHYRYEEWTLKLFFQVLLSGFGIAIVLPIVAIGIFSAIAGAVFPVVAPLTVIGMIVIAAATKKVTAVHWARFAIILFAWSIAASFVWGGKLLSISREAESARPICDTIQVEKTGNTVFIHNTGDTVIDQAEMWVIGNGEIADFGHIYQKQTGSYTYRTTPLFLGVMYLKGHVKGAKVQGPCIYREKQ